MTPVVAPTPPFEQSHRVDNETRTLAGVWHAVLTSEELGTEPVRVELLSLVAIAEHPLIQATAVGGTR